MTQTAQLGLPAKDVAAAFEHSITWEDDIWRADPVDVEQVHANARAKFFDLLVSVVEARASAGAAAKPATAARVLLFHGQSGAGKTHLIRALRTASHKRELAYFGYAQLTPDVGNYADYYLKRLLNSLDKPYDPSREDLETGLARMTRKLVADCDAISDDELETLAEGDFSEQALAEVVHDLADRIIAAPRFANLDIDSNIVRALLYLHRRDPRIDQRVRQYLQGRKLNALSQAAVAALDPNTGDGRAFEIIESLGRIMDVVDNAALVFCVDQVEDLRFFADAEDRFQSAVRDLIQIANRLPTAIVVISCLEDFYGHVRGVVAQSYIDRIEKTGPISLRERRTAEEARLIIAKRLREKLLAEGAAQSDIDPAQIFGPNFVEEFGGLSTRRLLEHAQNWLSGTAQTGSGFQASGASANANAPDTIAPDMPTHSLISTLAAALGFGGDQSGTKITPPPASVTAAVTSRSDNLVPIDPTGRAPTTPTQRDTPPRDTSDAHATNDARGHDADAGLVAVLANATPADGTPAASGSVEDDQPTTTDGIDWRDMWERFATAYEAELTDDDGALIDAIAAGLSLAATEWGDDVQAEVTIADLDQELPALDMSVTHATGHTFQGRVFLCNRPTQGGGFKRQIEKVLPNMDGRTCFMVRASEFPPSKKNQAAQVFRKYREAGGRHMMIAIPEWERMMTAREFHLHHQGDPGFSDWFASAKLVSGLTPIAQMLRLDLMGQALPPMVATTAAGGGRRLRDMHPHLRLIEPSAAASPLGTDMLEPGPGALTSLTPFELAGEPRAWDQDLGDPLAQPEQQIMDDVLAPAEPEPGSIEVGTYRHASGEIHLSRPILKRHCAVLGGSGSGKTTLALTIIEQLLLEGIPAILIDRKGDLCSYANPDVWKEISGEDVERSAARETLAAAADVAVYTPGRSAGRPISITLLPSGAAELPDEELELLARHSAEALGDMLHLKKSATNQKQMGTLQVALKLLGSRSSHEIMLADLIHLLEMEDPELDERMQRMDPSGKLRRDLVAQLDSLRYRNAALFEAGGENMKMEQLLGLGTNAKPDKTRLSIVYTGFLGDNENILFWVSQFLSEALRFCQRNPNDELQAVVMFDEADLYIPANAKPATADPLQSLLKRARSAGLGIMLATQSPGDLDYKSRDQITSWFIGRVREDTALRKLKAAFQSESGLDPAMVLPGQTVGEFHLVQERLVRPMRANRSLIQAEQVPFDRIETLASETRTLDKVQLPLFDVPE